MKIIDEENNLKNDINNNNDNSNLIIKNDHLIYHPKFDANINCPIPIETKNSKRRHKRIQSSSPSHVMAFSPEKIDYHPHSFDIITFKQGDPFDILPYENTNKYNTNDINGNTLNSEIKKKGNSNLKNNKENNEPIKEQQIMENLNDINNNVKKIQVKKKKSLSYDPSINNNNNTQENLKRKRVTINEINTTSNVINDSDNSNNNNDNDNNYNNDNNNNNNSNNNYTSLLNKNIASILKSSESIKKEFVNSNKRVTIKEDPKLMNTTNQNEQSIRPYSSYLSSFRSSEETDDDDYLTFTAKEKRFTNKQLDSETLINNYKAIPHDSNRKVKSMFENNNERKVTDYNKSSKSIHSHSYNDSITMTNDDDINIIERFSFDDILLPPSRVSSMKKTSTADNTLITEKTDYINEDDRKIPEIIIANENSNKSKNKNKNKNNKDNDNDSDNDNGNNNKNEIDCKNMLLERGGKEKNKTLKVKWDIDSDNIDEGNETIYRNKSKHYSLNYNNRTQSLNPSLLSQFISSRINTSDSEDDPSSIKQKSLDNKKHYNKNNTKKNNSNSNSNNNNNNNNTNNNKNKNNNNKNNNNNNDNKRRHDSHSIFISNNDNGLKESVNPSSKIEDHSPLNPPSYLDIAMPSRNISKKKKCSTEIKSSLREDVIKEIISSEKRYVNQLKILENIYIDPMSRLGLLTAEESSIVFSNVKAILMFHRDHLYPSMLKTYEEEEKEFGKMILSYLSFFKIYSEYYNNFEKSINFIEKLSANIHNVIRRRRIKSYLKTIKSHPDHSQISLQGFLILPVQRLPRYRLLYRELIRYTPSTHKDFKCLKSALNKLEKLVSECNERKREWESTERGFQLLRKAVDDFVGYDVNSRHLINGRFLKSDILYVQKMFYRSSSASSSKLNNGSNFTLKSLAKSNSNLKNYPSADLVDQEWINQISNKNDNNNNNVVIVGSSKWKQLMKEVTIKQNYLFFLFGDCLVQCTVKSGPLADNLVTFKDDENIRILRVIKFDHKKQKSPPAKLLSSNNTDTITSQDGSSPLNTPRGSRVMIDSNTAISRLKSPVASNEDLISENIYINNIYSNHHNFNNNTNSNSNSCNSNSNSNSNSNTNSNNKMEISPFYHNNNYNINIDDMEKEINLYTLNSNYNSAHSNNTNTNTNTNTNNKYHNNNYNNNYNNNFYDNNNTNSTPSSSSNTNNNNIKNTIPLSMFRSLSTPFLSNQQHLNTYNNDDEAISYNDINLVDNNTNTNTNINTNTNTNTNTNMNMNIHTNTNINANTNINTNTNTNNNIDTNTNINMNMNMNTNINNNSNTHNNCNSNSNSNEELSYDDEKDDSHNIVLRVTSDNTILFIAGLRSELKEWCKLINEAWLSN